MSYEGEKETGKLNKFKISVTKSGKCIKGKGRGSQRTEAVNVWESIYFLSVLVILSDMWVGNPTWPRWHFIVATTGHLKLKNDSSNSIKPYGKLT